MPTSQSDYLNSALAHAQKTSISSDEWCRRIDDQEDYAFKNTEWYKALKDLESAKTASSGGGGGTPPPTGGTDDAKARIFLANFDLAEVLKAPSFMWAVCTADHAYRSFYSPSVIDQLKAHFAGVETWCDCRAQSGYQEGVGTGYNEAVKMSDELGLNGAWGQCETQMEWDNAYGSGCRRMVGKISSDVCDDTRLAKVASGEVHLSVELYCNCMPWVQPDWRNANAGVGGNCIATYADATPCYYTPVQWYKDKGWYVPGRDSVYGVGLTSADWMALA